MTWLRSILSLISGKAWAAIWAVAGLLTALLYARKAGKDSVLKKQAERSADIAREANANRDEISRLPDAELDKRLRRFQPRD